MATEIVVVLIGGAFSVLAALIHKPTIYIPLAIILTSCGYDGSYRYPCQDPANWGNVECEPPICVPNGTCTRDLIYARTPNP